MNEKFLYVEKIFNDFRAELKALPKNFYEQILRDEIGRGYFGDAVKEIFSTLTEDEQNLILRALKLQELPEGRQLMFRLAAQSLFPTARIYFNAGKFLMYLPDAKTDSTLRKIELLKILFMDVSNAEIDLYFERHFGIFGTPQTMHLDKMILY